MLLTPFLWTPLSPSLFVLLVLLIWHIFFGEKIMSGFRPAKMASIECNEAPMIS